MTMTERLMANGDWGLRLRPDTPRQILNRLDLRTSGFGHVVVTSTYVDLGEMSDQAALALSSFTGVYQRQPSEREMGGPHVNVWAGGEDDKRGRSYGGLGVPGSGSWTDWRTHVGNTLNGSGMIWGWGPAPAGSVAGTYVNEFYRGTYRHVIETLSERFGTEWRITNSIRFDWAPPGNIFNLTPKSLIVAHSADAGRDYALRGIQGNLDVERDVEDWVWRVIYWFNNNTANHVPTGGIAEANVPLRGPLGAQAWVDLIIEDTQTADSAAAGSLAAAQWARFNPVREDLRLSSREFDIGRDVKVGDAVYVFDPARNLFDQARSNPVDYHGQTIYPRSIRCVGMTRPIREGMGVWFRRYVKPSGTWVVEWTDLTPYVEFENGDTVVEVGALPRKR